MGRGRGGVVVWEGKGSAVEKKACSSWYGRRGLGLSPLTD